MDQRVEVRAGGVVYPGQQQEGEKGEPQKEKSNASLEKGTHKIITYITLYTHMYMYMHQLK